MIERAIVVFPKFETSKQINDIRNKYDPLANLIFPHITLVFPFFSAYTTDELNLKLKSSLAEKSIIKIELCGITKQVDSYGNYLFLNLTEGNAEIESLHKTLYKQIFNEIRDTKKYIPHITIGKFSSFEVLEDAYRDTASLTDRFYATVDTISVVVINKHSESIINIEHASEIHIV